MMKRRAFLFFIFTGAAALAIAGANYFFLQKPMAQVAHGDPALAGIAVSVHYRFFVDPGTLVYDLQEVPPGTRPEDVTRMLVEFAGLTTSQAFGEVRLAWQGKVKFLLPGADFRKLGADPATLRKLPQRLVSPDGRRVADFAAWHRAWYIDALTQKIRAEMEQAA